MQMNDLILISVDDHLIEPRDLFEKHVPQKYRGSAPRVIVNKNGEERWAFDGKLLATVGSAAVAGRSREERCLEPANFTHMRPGCYQPMARIEDMSANGVLTSLCFGTMTGFAGEIFLRSSNRELMLTLLKSYNDWHIDDWCATAPDRFIPIGLIPLWDATAAAGEVRRVARKGARAICFPENPAALKIPTIHEGFWDPMFKVCVDEGVALCTHIGTGGASARPRCSRTPTFRCAP